MNRDQYSFNCFSFLQEIVIIALFIVIVPNETFCQPKDMGDFISTQPPSRNLVPSTGTSTKRLLLRSKRHSYPGCVKNVFYTSSGIVIECERGHPDCYEVAPGSHGRCETVKNSQNVVTECRCKGS